MGPGAGARSLNGTRAFHPSDGLRRPSHGDTVTQRAALPCDTGALSPRLPAPIPAVSFFRLRRGSQGCTHGRSRGCTRLLRDVPPPHGTGHLWPGGFGQECSLSLCARSCSKGKGTPAGAQESCRNTDEYGGGWWPASGLCWHQNVCSSWFLVLVLLAPPCSGPHGQGQLIPKQSSRPQKAGLCRPVLLLLGAGQMVQRHWGLREAPGQSAVNHVPPMRSSLRQQQPTCESRESE